jgi:signal transduction histidine kinase
MSNETKFSKYYETLSWLARSKEFHDRPRLVGLELICSKIAAALGVPRVGVWLYTIDREGMYEESTFQKSGNTQGMLLRKVDYPKYFKQLENDRVLPLIDVLDPKGALSEFIEGYSKSQNIRSLIDAPIISDGEMIGILCCETVGEKREWDQSDSHFVATCADTVARFLESEKRHTFEKELVHRINYLEKDLKKKLDDLNEAKLSLDLALEGAQVGKWDWEIATGKVFLNKTWYTKLGYEFNELPHTLETFQSRLHPSDKAKVEEEIQKHLRGETAFYECRFRMITKKGDTQWCLDRGCVVSRKDDGTPLKMTGVNVNVTPMIQWEQSVITSEQQLKAMIQSLPTPVAMFDKDFNYLAYSSRWGEEWQNFSALNDTKSARQILRPEWIIDMDEALKGHTISRDEALVELSPGMEVWLRWVIQPWKDANQNIGGVVVMAENITQRKEAEMRLTQTSKLSALGEMAGGIAHEINNPLSIIKGYIDLLRRHSGRQSLSPELLLQYIEKMDTTVGRISKIVNGMRRFSRESSMDEKVKYSAHKIIDETLDICLERMNNNGTAVEVQRLEIDPLIYCRPVEISQVFLNLLNNAHQAITTMDHPWIRIAVTEEPEFYRISISDSGGGIPVAVRKKLFQPFFTTKDIGVGTGLGLSISRGIIEEHKGKLYYLEDAPNTTFIIELPKLPADAGV